MQDEPKMNKNIYIDYFLKYIYNLFGRKLILINYKIIIIN